MVTVDQHTEQYWEIFDKVEERIIAHFFDEAEAQKYAEWLNTTALSKPSATD